MKIACFSLSIFVTLCALNSYAGPCPDGSSFCGADVLCINIDKVDAAVEAARVSAPETKECRSLSRPDLTYVTANLEKNVVAIPFARGCQSSALVQSSLDNVLKAVKAVDPDVKKATNGWITPYCE